MISYCKGIRILQMINTDLIFDSRLPFILNTIGESPRQGTVNRAPGPAWNQFLWIKRGEGKFHIDGDTVILGEGQGMFMREGIPHRYAPLSSTFHTAFCTFFATPNLVEYCIGDKAYLVFDVPDFLDRETTMLTQFARNNPSTLERSAAGYTYVTELFAAITKNSDDIITTVREFLENRCGEPLTLDDIAAVSGLDRFALCRYFKKHHKRSVMDELKVIRIKKAKRLLRYSSESIEEIGKQCGFLSASYFAMRFREECGCTPGEYRSLRMQ